MWQCQYPLTWMVRVGVGGEDGGQLCGEPILLTCWVTFFPQRQRNVVVWSLVSKRRRRPWFCFPIKGCWNFRFCSEKVLLKPELTWSSPYSPGWSSPHAPSVRLAATVFRVVAFSIDPALKSEHCRYLKYQENYLRRRLAVLTCSNL